MLAESGAAATDELASLAFTSTAALAELGEEMRVGQQEQRELVLKMQQQVRIGAWDEETKRECWCLMWC